MVAFLPLLIYNKYARVRTRKGCEMEGCRHTDSRCLGSRVFPWSKSIQRI